MYLKSLTLRGFKSFASATVFDFEPGLNVVVGPNGSGKSNLLDALTWVLGAQGAKTLRGGAMKDLIFSGSPQRPALGRARVELVLDNSEGKGPWPLGELRLARTMFAGGGSDYSLNGQPLKLGELQELLGDLGLGQGLHGLVGQGQVDRVLYGTAADRRQLIEEAAGLTKHRQRQAKASARLQALQGNLDRVEDLAAELSDQLEGRRDQAEAAQRAADLEAELSSAQADLLAFDLSSARAQLDDLEQRSESSQQALEASGRLLEELAAGEAADRRQLADLLEVIGQQEASKSQAQALLYRLDSLALLAQQQVLAGGEERQGAASLALAQARQKLAQEVEQLEQAQEKLLKLESEIEDLGGREKALDQAYRQALTSWKTLGEELLGAEDFAGLHPLALAVSQQGADLPSYLDLKNELEDLGRQHKEAQQALERAQASRLQAQDQAQAGAQALTAAQLSHRALAAQAQALETAYSQEGAPQDLPAGSQPLTDWLTVSPDWEEALSQLLAPYQQLLATDQGQALEAHLSYLYLPQDRSTLQALEQEVKDLQALYPASLTLDQVLEGPEPILQALTGLLGPLLFLTQPLRKEQQEALWRDYPHLTLVQAQGPILTAFSRSQLEKKSDSRLLLKAQWERTQLKAEAAQQAETQARKAADQAQEAARQAQQTEQKTAQKLGSLQGQIRRTLAQLAQLTQQTKEELAQIRQDKDQQQARRQEAQEALQTQTQTLETSRQALTRLEKAQDEEDSKRQLRAHRAEEAQLTLAKISYLTQILKQDVNQLSQELEASRAQEAQAKKSQADRTRTKEEEERKNRALTARQLQVQAALARAQAHYQGLEEKAQALVEMTVDQLLARPVPAQANRQSLLAAQAQAQQKVKEVGAVNPLALEEYRALQERHSRLQEQLADIKASRAQVRQVMDQVGQQIETSFEAAFQQIDQHFGRLFGRLFPQGTGRLLLADPQDPYSGIDLEVKPAGKRVSRLSLLSGGERSLASLAFLLAILLACPAPFAVLDEVEAALDDRNLARLLDLIAELKAETQLIMISHQRPTMQLADALYGISMSQGVSQLVSQKL